MDDIITEQDMRILAIAITVHVFDVHPVDDLVCDSLRKRGYLEFIKSRSVYRITDAGAATYRQVVKELTARAAAPSGGGSEGEA